MMRALRRIQISTARRATGQLSGNYHSGFRGQGLAFADLRQYHAGDDVRRIDWNVSARQQAPYVRVYTEEREMAVMLLVDASRSMEFGSANQSKLALATQVSSICAFSAAHQGDRVGLVLGGQKVETMLKPQKGSKQAMRILREVYSNFPDEGGTDLSLSLSTLCRICPRRSVAFLISDFFTEGYEAALGVAAMRHDLVPILINDPRDLELSDIGLVEFEDPESGELLLVNTSSKQVRDNYRHHVLSRREYAQKLFRKFRLEFCELSTAEDPVTPLRRLFYRRSRRNGR